MILHSLAVIVELASFKKESAVTLKLSALIVELLLTREVVRKFQCCTIDKTVSSCCTH